MFESDYLFGKLYLRIHEKAKSFDDDDPSAGKQVRRMTKNPRAPGSLPSGVSNCSYLPSNFLGTLCARPSESPARGAEKNIRFHDHLLKALTFLAPLLRGVVVHSCVERDNKRLNYPKTSDYNEQMYSFFYVGNCSDYSKRTM